MRKKLVIEAISSQPELISHYYSKDNRYCAIGAMAIVANIPLPHENNKDIGGPEMRDFRRALSATYRTTVTDLIRIQSINDAAEDAGRRDAVLRFIRSM